MRQFLPPLPFGYVVPVKILFFDTTSEGLKLFYARVNIAQQSFNDGINKEAHTALPLPCILPPANCILPKTKRQW
jgi:hypothetical protein